MSSFSTASRLKTADLTRIALFAVLIAVCAWITIPLPKPLVPFTLQTFAVFAAVTVLGGRRGSYAVGVYLLLGAVGIPVFAGGLGGVSVLLGSTGGYILGFLASALVYWLATALWPAGGLPAKFLGCLLGLLTCYILGTIWFVLVYTVTTGPVGIATALSWCVLPYVIPDLCKLAAAVAISCRLSRWNQ